MQREDVPTQTQKRDVLMFHHRGPRVQFASLNRLRAGLRYRYATGPTSGPSAIDHMWGKNEPDN